MDKWEKVGKPKGSKSKSQGKLNKTEKQAILKSMTTIDDLPLSKTQSPMFDGQIPMNGDVLPVAEAKPAAKAPKKKAKKPAEPKVQVYKTIEDAMKSEELKSFEAKVKQFQERIPDNQLLCGKEVASYLNLNLLCTEQLTAESARAENYPMSKTSKTISDTLMRSFGKKLRAPVVPLLFKYCLNCMVDCIARDQSAVGYQLCLQALAKNRQQLCLEDYPREKIVEEIISFQNQPKKCFAFMWAIAQTVGPKDPKSAYQVWLSVMLPTLSVKCVSAYSMDFIENLLKEKKTIDVLRVKADQFHKVCQWSFGSSEVVTKAQSSIKKRMEKIYSVFETAMLKYDASKQDYFVYYLNLDDKQPDEISNKLVELAITCLQTDNYCVTYWRDQYLQTIYKTRLFIEYFNSHPDELKKANKRKVFIDTIRSFRNTNEDLVAKSHPVTSKRDFFKIRKFCESCDDRQNDAKSSRCGSLLWTIIVLLIAVGVGVVLYDVNQNKGVWEGCQTEVFLKDSGATAQYHHVVAKVKVIQIQAQDWYEHKFPQYCQQMNEILQPYIIKIAELYETGTEKFVEFSEPLKVKMQPYIKQLREPFDVALKYCIQYALELTDFLITLFTQFCKYLLQLMKKGNAQLEIMMAEDFDWMQLRQDTIASLSKFFSELPDEITRISTMVYENVVTYVNQLRQSS